MVAKKQKITKSASNKRNGSKPGPQISDFDETAIIKKLADNSRPVREKALTTLGRFLSTSKKIDSFKLQKLWKGLFFTMWHSDRALTQQALAQELADLSLKVKDRNYWTFINAFWEIMSREWHSIDKYRIDKFYLLVRRYVCAMLTKLKNENFDPTWIEQYQENLEKYAFEASDPKIPHAIRLHLCDIYLDELEKLSEALSPELVAELLAPVLNFVSKTHFKTVRQYAISEILQDPRLELWGFTSDYTVVPQNAESDSDTDAFMLRDDSSDDESEEDASEHEVNGQDGDDEEEWGGFD